MASSDKENEIKSDLVDQIVSKPITSAAAVERVRRMRTTRGDAVEKLTDYALEAIDAMAFLMRNGDVRTRYAAAAKILEYAIGKPGDMKSNDVSVGDEEEVTDVEFEQIIKEEGKEEEFQAMIEKGYKREKGK